MAVYCRSTVIFLADLMNILVLIPIVKMRINLALSVRLNLSQ
ncbi:hypothetical protein BMETH_758_0 [methanotrophic bacterial endosymbiont of Bathymodiolus sp.]|nr:hypothetical protein BMETH_758_0 [methanotrophic bacterial endosymbiont of Bathymodiolus sp.]